MGRSVSDDEDPASATTPESAPSMEGQSSGAGGTQGGRCLEGRTQGSGCPDEADEIRQGDPRGTETNSYPG